MLESLLGRSDDRLGSVKVTGAAAAAAGSAGARAGAAAVSSMVTAARAVLGCRAALEGPALEGPAFEGLLWRDKHYALQSQPFTAEPSDAGPSAAALRPRPAHLSSVSGTIHTLITPGTIL